MSKICDKLNLKTHDTTFLVERNEVMMNTELHEKTLTLVKEERRITGLVIENLQKISDTKLFLRLGYSSLFEYCTVNRRLTP